jgi:hypothetical protein
VVNTGLEGQTDKGSLPDDGDVMVCPLCGLLSVFFWADETLCTRRPSMAELERALERPEVARAVQVAADELERMKTATAGNGKR